MFITKEEKGMQLFTEITENTRIYEVLTDSAIELQKKQNRNKLKDLKANTRACCVQSEMSGTGKTFFIEQEAESKGYNLRSILLAGENSQESLEARFKILEQDLSNPETKLAVHIKLDMMDNMNTSCEVIDQILFSVCILKYLPYKDGYLFFDNVHQVYIEV